MGLANGKNFATWAAKGLQHIRDIGSVEDQDWRLALDLFRVTNSWKTNTLRTALTSQVPKTPSQAKEISTGHWIVQEFEGHPAYIYHLTQHQTAGTTTTDVYSTREGSLQLTKQGPQRIQLQEHAQQICVKHTSDCQLLGYNSANPPPPITSVSLHHPCRIRDID